MARPTWTPEGFDDWQSFFPATGFVRPPAPLDLTDRFISCWHQPEARLPKSTLIVLIAGPYSEFMPRCFHGVPRALKSSGHEVLRVPVRSSRGVMAQGSHISKVLTTHLRQGQRFVVLAHSKGGLDALAALAQSNELQKACDGIALVQPPAGASTLVDELLDRTPGIGRTGLPAPHYRLDRLRRTLVNTRWLAGATRDISSRRDRKITQLLDELPGNLNAVHVVSWSASGHSFLDTHHTRLDRLRPRHAHDGQFYIERLCLPNVPQICLPHLDHGQPVLGGGGFDQVRFWMTLLDVLQPSSRNPQAN